MLDKLEAKQSYLPVQSTTCTLWQPTAFLFNAVVK